MKKIMKKNYKKNYEKIMKKPGGIKDLFGNEI